MRLVKLRLQNFRCFRTEFTVEFEDLTAIVGRNDVGKSAIMDALAIFFEEAKLDKDDASVDGDRKALKITCEFDELPPALVLDEDYETSLSHECLTNEEGRLEITKSYDGSLTAPKLTSVEAHAMHPTAEGYSDLLQLKKTELIARAKQLGIDLAAVNKQANAPIRAAIRAACPDLRIGKVPVSLEKEGGKQLWAAVGSYIPAFALFKSDRASTDQDAEAQDPLKAAIKDAIKAVEPELQRVQAHVETEVRKIAEATVAKIREMDPSLAETLNPLVTTKKWDSLFQTSITGDLGIPLNKRGSGIKRLVLLNFFRANAERAATERQTGSIIYAIEEPETSQHPRNQRMLMSALTELSATTGRQVILTTHTPMLARALPDGCLRFIEKQADGSRSLLSGGGDTNARIAASLGVLPDHSVKIFVGVEGKHDISFLKGMSRMLSLAGRQVPDLEALETDGHLIFFPFGGSNLALWSSRLLPLNRPEYHICDRDHPPPAAPKYQDHIDRVNARNGCKAVATGKREMENYLHPEAVREAYLANGVVVAFGANFAAFDDVPELVAKAVYETTGQARWVDLDGESRSGKVARAKSILNISAVANMTPERLAETDVGNDLVGWLMEIQEIMAAAQ